MAKATLLVLAAGLGSRYGGIKQMDPINSHGQFILDYSIYDAIRAGFDKVVLIIRDELREPLEEHFARLKGKIDISYVAQHLDMLPAGFACPAERKKPWGTGHAIWCAKDAIDSPFAAINADDFYGAKTYKVLADFLLSGQCDAKTYAMVAFQLKNTLSENGTVSRGICQAENGFLTSVVERTDIAPTENGARFKDENGAWQPLTGDEPSSMNFWGFSPSLFAHLETAFTEFLKARGQELKSEFYIPFVVDALIKQNAVRTRVLETPEKWFGMTYSEDHDMVIDSVRRLTEQGIYPDDLWANF